MNAIGCGRASRPARTPLGFQSHVETIHVTARAVSPAERTFALHEDDHGHD
jgi:hypothetical protein